MTRAIRAFLMRVRGVFRGDRAADDVSAEIEANLQLHGDDNLRAGMDAVEARRRALVALGGVAATAQSCRERVGLPIVDHLVQDLRYGLRGLRAGTSWLAIGLLTLAIGLTTAMFAVVDALMLRPVPFPDADRLAQVSMRGEHGSRPPMWSVIAAWKKRAPFEAVGAWLPDSMVIETDAGPLVRTSALVTPGTFELLGVPPIKGRTFTDEDAADRSLMISEDLWRQAFRADPNVIGRSVLAEGKPAVIVGIVSSRVRFPRWDTQIWRPLAPGADRPVAVVRFATGRPPDDALRVATAIAHEVDATSTDQRVEAFSVAGRTNSKYFDSAVPMIGGGVALVFLTLCANVSGLLLTRFNARRRQFGLCAALGASRRRLLSQAFVETAVLGAAGAVGGVMLAWQLVRIAQSLLPRSFLARSLHPLQLDVRTLAMATGLAVLATLLAGLLPAWIGTRLQVGSSLRLAERGGTETRGARFLTRCLVVGEVALACTLLVGMALLVGSFGNLAAIDRGFDSHRLTMVQLAFDAKMARDRAARLPLIDQTSTALRSLPGVTRVAWSYGAPAVDGAISFGDWIPDAPGARPVNMTVRANWVGGDFFDLYRIDFLRGRPWQPGDSPDAIVIDERIAMTLWPGIDPVGHTVSWDKRQLRVVGVVRSVHRLVIDRGQDYPAVYWPFELGGRSATVGLRCAAACPSEGVIRQRLLSVGPVLQVETVKTLDETFEEDLSEPKLTASVAVVFAAIGLVAAAGGLFGVLSYAVGRRRREFGIRTALGASTRTIGSLVLRDGANVALVGLAIGSITAWYLARALASVQYGVTISDPSIWLGVVGVLTLTIGVACWQPARAAMRVDPVALLREE